MRTALQSLAGVLDPYIERVTALHVPAGKDWTVLLAAKDAQKGIEGKEYSRTDPQDQFRIITEPIGQLGYLFNAHLSRTEQGFVGELRGVRNDVAHFKPFAPDDAVRALDTIERVMRAVGAAREADAVRKARLDILSGDFEQRTRKAVRAAALPGTADAALPSWRDVLKPHADVATGRYNNAEFAADLYSVAVQGNAASEYQDPVEFFRRTYLTAGLKELLRRAVDRISGSGSANPVINLQTTFGGGKTHSMLAVWHLFSGRSLYEFPQGVQDLLAGEHADVLGKPVRKAALVGNEIPPATPSQKPDGTVVHTLWGELAWQLGGAEGYAIVADADETGTNPGNLLRELFTKFGPALILIDEWVAYARQLPDAPDPMRPVPGGLFETQFTFAQSLTLAAENVPGTLLLVSVPASEGRQVTSDRDYQEGETPRASDLEVGGQRGRDTLHRLDYVIRRVAYQWSPATRDESYEIVRRRLFEEPDANAIQTIASAARRFTDYYRHNHKEFPTGVGESEYESRIKAAYPIHPELLDRLYSDWSTLEKFQRTRGVLRLMSHVVHELYEREDLSPLIMTGSIPLDAQPVRSEIVQYLDNAWDAIIQSEIDGDNSVARTVDEERPALGDRSLALRTARTIFVEATPTLDAALKGKDRKSITLGVAMPGDVLGNVGSVLDGLQEKSSHYYAEDGRFWYDTQPSLNRLAAERAAQLSYDAVYGEVATRLKRVFKGSTDIIAGVVHPESSSEVEEADYLRLVVVPPQYTHNGKDKDSSAARWVYDLLRQRGKAPRSNVNTIVAVAADDKQWGTLESAVRSYVAWNSIFNETARLDLTQSAAAQAQSMLEAANRTVDDRLGHTWIWGLHAVQDDPQAPFAVGQVRADGQERNLTKRISAKLAAADIAHSYIADRVIRLDVEEFLRARWTRGFISFTELWAYYTRYPYLHRLRDKAVLVRALEESLFDVAFLDTGFALAAGFDTTTGDFLGLAVPLEDTEFGPFDDRTLVVRPDLAVAQRERERSKAVQPRPVPGNSNTALSPGDEPGGDGMGATRSATPTLPPRRITNATYSLRHVIDPGGDMPTELQTIAQEILDLLRNADPDVLDITLTVDAQKSDGFDENTVRAIKQNAGDLAVVNSSFGDL
ncbi:Swt1 family HEPN domain-containing protein [Raineyella sp. LH-20]|uniref:Swt1 family HEPN domain-containing protein n=1 Tax=Raineyella sp. LH-20 TaxID=3081204 RepID=UPI002953C04D|nr:Swt1 family HEPN domain-containing protein [Raineyella sp. LH-20]WOP19303.1 Swt1 family HEPN domain-containing protein [Raineyella sp. LH-20]